VRILKDLDTDIKGKHVLIVEDIIDSGLTLHYLLRNLQAREPRSVEVCALLTKPERREVDLNEIIREVLRLLHSDLLGRSTTVTTDLAPGLAPVSADPVHLQQVLLNLIMNSLEAMQHTPVPQRRIAITTARDNGFVRVSVRDHGVGLPEGDPDKIFAHFFSTKPNGMGMGLTIVRSIVEGHGGELGAENVEGGARFFFSLPVSG